MDLSELDELMSDAEWNALEENALTRLRDLLKWYRQKEHECAAEIEAINNEPMPEEAARPGAARRLMNALAEKHSFRFERLDLISVLIAIRPPLVVTPGWHV